MSPCTLLSALLKTLYLQTEIASEARLAQNTTRGHYYMFQKFNNAEASKYRDILHLTPKISSLGPSKTHVQQIKET